MSVWKQLLLKFNDAFWQTKKNSNTTSIVKAADLNYDVRFAHSIVALAAKMAKADGNATYDETMAFRSAFPIAKEDELAFTKLFGLAKASVLGYEGYAKQIGKRYKNNKTLLKDVLSVLFIVAAADGIINSDEEVFLKNVSTYFGLSETDYARVSYQFIKTQDPDPYFILGIDEDATDIEVKIAWLKLVTENHPDSFIASGQSLDFIKLAHEKTSQINNAYSKIKELRRKK